MADPEMLPVCLATFPHCLRFAEPQLELGLQKKQEQAVLLRCFYSPRSLWMPSSVCVLVLYSLRLSEPWCL